MGTAYSAYLVARVEMTAAPFPDYAVPPGGKYMRRCRDYVKNVHRFAYDAAEIARRDVK